MAGLPTGTVTFFFADIEGSTRLLQYLGDRYAEVLADYRRLLLSAILERNGQEVGTQGDAFFIIFRRAKDALTAAIAAQRAINSYHWPEGVAVRVRMGLHTGEALIVETGYVGIDVHRAARIGAAGHGGQILLSETTYILVKDHLPDRVSLRDLGGHRLKDLAHPHRLFQVVAANLPADFPLLKSLNVLPNNLPIQLTSFIGREQEIADVKKLLTTGRLLTLTGAGGSGKTRLALQVAADLLGQYPDGVWLIELAALADPALVPQTVASALGVPEQPGRALTEALVDSVRPKSLLLLLDNCEHLLLACARLADVLLRACENLRILATSRESLGIAGESLYPVPTLPAPNPLRLPSLQDFVQYEAVRLFTERAAAVLPTFRVTQQNAPYLALVCYRLDGIPLALELAAARVKMLPVEQLAKRLDDRFRLLTGGSRTALPRHQTLRAAMDWSYHLLSERERVVLRRLSVFADGWTLEAAEAVCAAGDGEAFDILDLLAQLVFKSLVLMNEQDGRVRYRFLETVRQYALERLVESEDAPAVRTRHLDWYRGLTEEAEAGLVGVRQAAWLDRLEAEHDNLRAALEWSLECGAVEAGLRLAGGVWQFWSVRGYLAEGRRWLDALLKRSTGVAPIVRAKALRAAGRLAGFGQGDYAYGRVAYEESLAIWRDVGDRKWIATLIGDLGVLAFGQGDFGAARVLYEESLAIWRDVGDRWGVALSLHNLGRAAYRQGDWAAARTLFEESLAICRELGDTQGIAVALTNLGFVAFSRGDYASAPALFEEGLTMQQELGDKRRIAYSLEGFAFLTLAQGKAQRAARLVGAAEALRESIGAPLPPIDRADYERMVASVRSALGDDLYATAWEEGRGMTLELAVREAKWIG